MREPLLSLERRAVIIRMAGVGLHEQIAHLRIRAPAEDRLAAGQRAGLIGIEIPGMARNLARAKKQIAGRERNPTADLVRNLRARLMTVRRADRAVDRVGEPDIA